MRSCGMSQRSIPAVFALCLVGLLVLLSSFPRWRTAGKSPAVDAEWKTTTHDNDADDASHVKQSTTKEKNGTTKGGKKKSPHSCKDFKPRTTEDRAKMDGFVGGLDYGSVKTYVMFWAFQRSGHSWIGAVLDAGPNALIANEWHALKKYQKDPTMTTRSLYDGLAQNSYLCGIYGRIQVYNYTMPGLWQGQVTSRHGLQVIGDKRGGGSTGTMLHVGNQPWESPADAQAQSNLYDGFMKVTGAEPRNIIVLRNPFDIVATKYLRHSGKGRSPPLEKVENTLKLFEEVLWAKDHLGHPTQWHLLTMEDFARNTEKELLDLCNFTGIECPESMISKTIEQTHHSPHQSRDSVSWTTEAKDLINTFIGERLADHYAPWTEE